MDGIYTDHQSYTHIWEGNSHARFLTVAKCVVAGVFLHLVFRLHNIHNISFNIVSELIDIVSIRLWQGFGHSQ